MRLVQMVRRRDDDRVERVLLEQILDVGEDVGDAEAVGERARLRPVVVAERDELRAAHLRQHRQMRELRDGSRADDADSNGLLHGFALTRLLHAADATKVIRGPGASLRRAEAAHEIAAHEALHADRARDA